MQTSNQITIHGDYDRVFELGANIEKWPEILPHYRFVKLHKKDGNKKWVTMSAWRNFIPVTWSAIETVVPGSRSKPGKIIFKHIKGLVRGMDVEWSFEVSGKNVVVTIAHDLPDPPYPVRILGRKLTEVIVGKGFIGNIAGKTLRRVKELAESDGS